MGEVPVMRATLPVRSGMEASVIWRDVILAGGLGVGIMGMGCGQSVWSYTLRCASGDFPIGAYGRSFFYSCGFGKRFGDIPTARKLWHSCVILPIHGFDRID